MSTILAAQLAESFLLLSLGPSDKLFVLPLVFAEVALEQIGSVSLEVV